MVAGALLVVKSRGLYHRVTDPTSVPMLRVDFPLSVSSCHPSRYPYPWSAGDCGGVCEILGRPTSRGRELELPQDRADLFVFLLVHRINIVFVIPRGVCVWEIACTHGNVISDDQPPPTPIPQTQIRGIAGLTTGGFARRLFQICKQF